MKLFILFFAISFYSCQDYKNPPFIVIKTDNCFDNGMQTYYSSEGNMVLTYCSKYQIGDTIPNVANYSIK